ncbi:exodeoxyribonuclease III [Patescibacteria group bacterium]|nr:exodeoxyribonuclease III [Patescibacteria group bacterium]
MKIISWNVNGLRAVLKKGFLDFLNQEKPDILCLQEIKISSTAIAKENFDFKGYLEFYYPAIRPGYSGTAIFIREGLIKAKKDFKIKNGFSVGDFDDEGRTQILEADNFYLINSYFPNSRADLSRLDFKLKFNEEILKLAKKLEKKKPVIMTGDFNVAHEPIDLARPKANEGESGYTKEERDSMTEILKTGFIDSFRYFNPNKVQYSWWSFRAGARQRNVGWRIDYFCVSAKLKKSIKKAYILDKTTGSDHAPIVLEVF